MPNTLAGAVVLEKTFGAETDVSETVVMDGESLLGLEIEHDGVIEATLTLESTNNRTVLRGGSPTFTDEAVGLAALVGSPGIETYNFFNVNMLAVRVRVVATVGGDITIRVTTKER
ncbi:MAG: hypothetical protein ACE5LB_14980 [Acidiferrobacterales bacterium]